MKCPYYQSEKCYLKNLIKTHCKGEMIEKDDLYYCKLDVNKLLGDKKSLATLLTQDMKRNFWNNRRKQLIDDYKNKKKWY